ncbi:MAG TPA: M23 family metallopeptidase [Chthoniobacterales bacterium]|nr:M23 family metallopeptidase [Chthoniobacterales bacterium]
MHCITRRLHNRFIWFRSVLQRRGAERLLHAVFHPCSSLRLFFFSQWLLSILAVTFLLVFPLSGRLFAKDSPKQVHLASGFDFPVDPPNADEFYKSRGFRKGGHLGEDWLHEGGSSCSFGCPVTSIAHGFVILARDIHVAWGNVVIVRHAYLEQGVVHFIDSLYAHLNRIDVKEGDTIQKGQALGSIGNNHGMYPAHLHFELHKNLNVGVNHTGFAKDTSNYWIPTDFIIKRRNLKADTRLVSLPISHFDIPSPSRRIKSAVTKKKKKTTRLSH